MALSALSIRLSAVNAVGKLSLRVRATLFAFMRPLDFGASAAQGPADKAVKTYHDSERAFGPNRARAGCMISWRLPPWPFRGQGWIGCRVAAILAADVAGYNRLMEADEGRMARVLRGHCAGPAPSPGEVIE